jgi:hypothetical protein
MDNSNNKSTKTSSKNSATDNNISDKNVTHTDHRSKKTSNKAPSSGNIKGI